MIAEIHLYLICSRLNNLLHKSYRAIISEQLPWNYSIDHFNAIKEQNPTLWLLIIAVSICIGPDSLLLAISSEEFLIWTLKCLCLKKSSWNKLKDFRWPHLSNKETWSPRDSVSWLMSPESLLLILHTWEAYVLPPAKICAILFTGYFSSCLKGKALFFDMWLILSLLQLYSLLLQWCLHSEIVHILILVLFHGEFS